MKRPGMAPIDDEADVFKNLFLRQIRILGRTTNPESNTAICTHSRFAVLDTCATSFLSGYSFISER